MREEEIDYFDFDLSNLIKKLEVPQVFGKLCKSVSIARDNLKRELNKCTAFAIEDFYDCLDSVNKIKIQRLLFELAPKDAYSWGFRGKMIQDFQLDVLIENLDYFLSRAKDGYFAEDDSLLILLNRFLQQGKFPEIYKAFKYLIREKNKKAFLKKMPQEKIAFALSDNSERIRNFTKKLLGLKASRNVNHQNRIKQKIRKVLSDAFAGKLEKNKTCNFTLKTPIQTTNRKVIIKSIVFEWDSWALADKERDDSIAFRLYFGSKRLTSGMKWYEKYPNEIRVDKLPNLPPTITQVYSVYRLQKKDYRDLIRWIEKELVSFIKNY